MAGTPSSLAAGNALTIASGRAAARFDRCGWRALWMKRRGDGGTSVRRAVGLSVCWSGGGTQSGWPVACETACDDGIQRRRGSISWLCRVLLERRIVARVVRVYSRARPDTLPPSFWPTHHSNLDDGAPNDLLAFGEGQPGDGKPSKRPGPAARSGRRPWAGRCRRSALTYLVHVGVLGGAGAVAA